MKNRSIFLTVLKAGNSTIGCQSNRSGWRPSSGLQVADSLTLSSSSGRGKWSPPCPVLALFSRLLGLCWVLLGPQTAGGWESKAGSCSYSSPEKAMLFLEEGSLLRPLPAAISLYPQADKGEMQTASSERRWTLNRGKHVILHIYVSSRKDRPGSHRPNFHWNIYETFSSATPGS